MEQIGRSELKRAADELQAETNDRDHRLRRMEMEHAGEEASPVELSSFAQEEVAMHPDHGVNYLTSLWMKGFFLGMRVGRNTAP
jgi:hypothetical protein